MFYSQELLSVRYKGKLARCWLAATLSEKMFKRTVSPTILERIEIAKLCIEILTMVREPDNVTSGRFSLYLSSQLLYGTAKILFYQTEQLQDDLLTRGWILNNVRNSRKQKFDLALALKEPEIPPFEIFNDGTAAPDLNLITDDVFVFEHMMEDEQNFGVLTNCEMERFLLPEEEEQFLNEIRTFQQPPEIIEETVQIPPMDLNNFDIETIQSKNETINIDIRDISFKKPATPAKRTTESLPETSTKKRKISSKEIQIRQSRSSVDVPLLAYVEVPSSEGPIVPESVMESTDVSVQGPVVSTESPTRQAHIIEEEEFILVSRRGGIKFVDKKTVLSDFEMQRCIRNVAAHTKKCRLNNTHLHSAEYYFQKPCAKISHGVLGKQLVELFSRHMITRLVTDNEFTDIDISLDALRHDDTVRAGAASEIHERTVDISSELAVSNTAISKHSPTVEKILLTERLELKLPEEQIEMSRKEIDETYSAILPDIIEFEENIEESPKLTQKSSKRHINTPKTSPFSSKVTITKREMGALFQVHWQEGPFAKFHEIIPPDAYSKLDAAYTFHCLLEFHAEKRMVLKQAKPYDTIWIEKPMESSEESNGESL